MSKQWKLGIILGVFTLLLLVLGACSQDDEAAKDDEEDVSAEEKENGEEAEEEEGEPEYGGTYTISTPAPPQTLDPLATQDPWTHYYSGLVYNKLITFETGPDVESNDYIITSDLADEWEASDDGLEYTFHLREAYWHDIEPVNGRQVVAEDVVSTMERIQTMPGHQVGYLSAVESIEAPDESTVVFTLNEPFAPFLNYMANHYMWILPKEANDGDIDLRTTAVGTGPFMLEEYKENIEATFVRNPNFFEEGKPYLDGVKILNLSDSSAAINAFRAGELEQMVNPTSQEDKDNLIKANPELETYTSISSAPNIFYANMTKEPFDDIRVREAMMLAIDKQSAVDQIFGGGEIASPVNPSIGDFALPLEEREALQPYDVEKAKKLLAEAGYEDGLDVELLASDMFGPQGIRVAEWLVEDFKAIGINATIDIRDGASYQEKWAQMDYDIGVSYQTPFQEADEWLYSQYHSEASRNWFGIDDPKLDEMLEKQRTIMERDERKEYIHEIQRYIMEEVINPVAMFTPHNKNLKQPYVKNYYPHASYGFINMKNVWFDE